MKKFITILMMVLALLIPIQVKADTIGDILDISGKGDILRVAEDIELPIGMYDAYETQSFLHGGLLYCNSLPNGGAYGLGTHHGLPGQTCSAVEEDKLALPFVKNWETNQSGAIGFNILIRGVNHYAFRTEKSRRWAGYALLLVDAGYIYFTIIPNQKIINAQTFYRNMNPSTPSRLHIEFEIK